jgi:hypothetical protein
VCAGMLRAGRKSLVSGCQEKWVMANWGCSPLKGFHLTTVSLARFGLLGISCMNLEEPD